MTKLGDCRGKESPVGRNKLRSSGICPERAGIVKLVVKFVPARHCHDARPTFTELPTGRFCLPYLSCQTKISNCP